MESRPRGGDICGAVPSVLACTQLELEQLHLCEMVADVAEGWCEAAPDLRMLEHPGHLLTHSRFEVDRVALQVRIV